MKISPRLRPTRAVAATAAAVLTALLLGGTALANLDDDGEGAIAGLLPGDDQSLLDDGWTMDEQEFTDDWTAEQADTKLAAGAIDFARDQLGKPYQWGGQGPNAFDCSGLVVKAFAAAGVNLPRVTYQQWRAGERIPAGQEQPGDLVFMRMEKRGPGHVGLVTQPGRMIHAPRRGDVVRRASYAGRGDVVGFVRVTRPDGMPFR